MKNCDVGWGAISECNMKCKFCYSMSVRKEVKDDNVGLKEWIAFIDSNHENINSINYGTGENSLSDDWFRLIDYISTNYGRIKQAITTNGTLYNRIMENPEFERIFNKSISEVDVSLDFYKPRIHDNFRGLEGTYESAVGMLDYCKDKDIETTLVFIGIDEVLQIDNLKGIFEIAEDNRCKLRTNIFRPMNISSSLQKKFIAKFTTIINCLKWINENHEILYLGDPLFSSVLTENQVEASDPSGIKSIRILSNGDITPSTYLVGKEFRKYNIRTENILEQINFDNMGLDSSIPHDCRTCDYANKCRGGVLDRRYLWYKTFNAQDPYCIYREENWVPDFLVTVNKNKRRMESIHKDYLPTMFFHV